MLVPSRLYARDDGRFTNSPLTSGLTALRAGTDRAALLLMVSVFRMSIGTHRRATIVYEFMGNGLWCQTQQL